MRGRELLDISSRTLPGKLCASTPETVRPEDFDLVVLGMQESQYGTEGVRELMARIAKARVASLAIMNMPPLPYLERIPGLSIDALKGCYTDPSVWDGFEPELVTLASPDPQAFRPLDQARRMFSKSACPQISRRRGSMPRRRRRCSGNWRPASTRFAMRARKFR